MDKQNERILFFEELFKVGELSQKPVTELLSLANKLVKVENEFQAKNHFSQKKIAVLGSVSTQLFTKLLKLFLYQYDIFSDIYEGTYSSTYTECMDTESDLFKYSPDYLLMITHHTDIKQYPPMLSDETTVSEWLFNEQTFFTGMWGKIHERLPETKILFTNFIRPVERVLFNLEANCAYSRDYLLNELNQRLIENKPSYVTLIDADYLASCIGKYNWFSEKDYFLTKQGCAMQYLPSLVSMFTNQIASANGYVRKCLVLDLDNTLWGGVVGDDGPLGIQLSQNHPVGEAFLSFQHYLKRLKERGVILAVCSKNEPELAKEPFVKNPDMVLKLEDISCFVANWDDKAGNLKTVADNLNIGLDSLVFFDDNPAEREIVKTFLPQVLVVPVPEDPAEYVTVLQKTNCFDWSELTKEDLNRSGTYAAAQMLKESGRQFVDYESYLRDLQMSGFAGPVQEHDLERFTQLINKSNQFNLRTARYTDTGINELFSSQNAALICVKLRDKFSDYGLISCIILKKQGDTAFIDTWVMSCRVLKRGAEHMAWNLVVEQAAEMGCRYISGEYLATSKNKMVEKFLEGLCLDVIEETSTSKKYSIKIKDTKQIPHHILKEI